MSFLTQDSYAISQNSTLDDQGNYANPTLGISFQAPQGWTVQEPKKYQPEAPAVAIIAPYSSGFTASISLDVEKANGTTLANFVEGRKSILAEGNQSDNITFLSEQNSTLGGAPAETSTFEEKFGGQNNTYMIKFEQVIAQAGGNFYTITYANDVKDFDTYLPSFEQVLSSMKLGGNNLVLPIDYLSFAVVGVALAVGVMFVIRKKRRPGKADNPKK